LEFDSLCAELSFFARHGLRIDDVEISVDLQPGELLVFDNLAFAHGRRGRRRPGELHQRMFGHSLGPAAQRKVRDAVLAAFYARQPDVGALSTASMP
jgi:alpha-ketoglutarate-dependent taurine dioxygenase